MTTTAEVLRDAKALIADPDRWIKGRNQMILDGRKCYCSVGAIEAAAQDDSAYTAAWIALHDSLYTWPAQFNDSPKTTHADVMAAFDRAIAAEESA